jgi:nitrite reductase/ring-hydroxylating ferredoxin subunit
VTAPEATPSALPIPDGLQAVGTRDQPFVEVGTVHDLPLGAMRRFTRGDSDYLLAHTERGICVTDDRCPHMSAPLSIGSLDDCVVGCPLHKGRFDLASGEVVQFPTTGGLDPDGGYHPPWSPGDAPNKQEPTDLKAQARALTRVRRMRYYRVRIVGGTIEAQLP